MKNLTLLSALLFIFSLNSCVKEEENVFNGYYENVGNNSEDGSYSSFKITNVQILNLGQLDGGSLYFTVSDQDGVNYHNTESYYIYDSDLPASIAYTDWNEYIPITNFTSMITVTINDYPTDAELKFIPNDKLGQSSFQLSDQSTGLIANLTLQWN